MCLRLIPGAGKKPEIVSVNCENVAVKAIFISLFLQKSRMVTVSDEIS